MARWPGDRRGLEGRIRGEAEGEVDRNEVEETDGTRGDEWARVIGGERTEAVDLERVCA